MGRVYGYSLLGYVGRLGNQLWQVAATIDHALGDPGSRAAIPSDWEYRPLLSLPESLYRSPEPGEEIVDVAHLVDGPYYQALPHISRVSEALRRLYAPSSVGGERLRVRREALSLPRGHLTGIHVRRTDYLDNPERFPQLTPAYYQGALKAVRSYHLAGTTPVIFSDDPVWCRENAEEWFGEGPTVFVDDPHVRPIDPRARTSEPADIYDLWLMSECDAHVIANSSFSWWAAYLGLQKMVFYPDRWFGASAQHVERQWEAFPENWIQLPC
jgi:hypothetical protein